MIEFVDPNISGDTEAQVELSHQWDALRTLWLSRPYTGTALGTVYTVCVRVTTSRQLVIISEPHLSVIGLVR